jgi:hypothetical protein
MGKKQALSGKDAIAASPSTLLLREPLIKVIPAQAGIQKCLTTWVPLEPALDLIEGGNDNK